MTTIPPVVTWYLIDKNSGKQRELRGRTDDYTLNLYRGKGFVLDKKYLDPQLWNQLEYEVKPPTVTVAPPVPLGTTDRLAKAIRRAMSDRVFWELTASELLLLVGAGQHGIPKDSTRLSTEVMTPRVTAALKSYGIDVVRRRSNGKRLLHLKSITQ
jgi:hypothetical protein